MIGMILRDSNRELSSKDKNEDTIENASDKNDDELSAKDEDEEIENKKKDARKKKQKNAIIQADIISKNEYNKTILTDMIVRKLRKEMKNSVYLQELGDLSLRQIAARTKILATDAISNFSILKHQFHNGIGNSDYDLVLKHVRDKEYDSQINQTEKYLKKINAKGLTDKPVDCSDYENSVLTKYKECDKEITKQKKIISEFREQNSNKQTNIRTQKTNLKKSMKKLELNKSKGGLESFGEMSSPKKKNLLPNPEE